MNLQMSSGISLTPGFSPMAAGEERENRFNGLSRAEKPLKRLERRACSTTRLKPGVNEKRRIARHFCQCQWHRIIYQ
jgi:hypothetical protein